VRYVLCILSLEQSGGISGRDDDPFQFSGLKNVDNSGVLAFPKISICFDCGFSGFTTPETELRILGNGIAGPVAA
jgi:hypothetical protein